MRIKTDGELLRAAGERHETGRRIERHRLAIRGDDSGVHRRHLAALREGRLGRGGAEALARGRVGVGIPGDWHGLAIIGAAVDPMLRRAIGGDDVDRDSGGRDRE